MSAPSRLVLALALLVPLGSAPPVDAGTANPDVAYFADGGIDVTSLDGTVLHSFGTADFFSLDGNLIARSRLGGSREFIVGSDATTGQRRFRIENAFAPIALANGSRVGFLPDRFAHRDPYFASVWLRKPNGAERAVVRFAGPHRTANAKDFEGEGAPLDQAWDNAGRTLAVTFGNDVDLFIYDVWVVDVATREVTRATRGHVSRFPSLSPSGDRLALVRETDLCGGPDPGYRASVIRTMTSTAQDKTTLLPGDCDVFYTDPRWISEDELVLDRLTRTGPGAYDVDLVRADADTGTVTPIVTTGDVSFFNVSADLQVVAYERSSVSPGFFVYDLTTGTTTAFSDGFLPHLSGAHRLI